MYRPAFFLGSLKRQATSRGIWTSRKAASSNAIPPDLAGVNISPAFDLTCLGGEDVLDGRSLRNQETKATGLEGMGRQVLTYCRSSGRLAQPMTMLALGTLKRTFSSMREGDPHISQLIDEYLNEDEDGSGFSLEGGVMMIHFNPIIKEAPLIRHLLTVFPPELLASKGLHPAIDYWARKGSPTQFGSPPVILPLSADGSELGKWERKVVLGRTLIALFGDPFEHCYGPAYDHIEPICQTTYTRPQVDHLLNNLIPLSGPKADASILKWGLEPLFDIDSDTKPSYRNWTDISWVKNIPLVRPSAKPYTITKS